MFTKTLKKYLLSILRGVKFLFLNRKNKKRLNNQKDWIFINQVKYCSIRQDRTIIKDIIEMKANPKEDKDRSKSWAMSLDDYEKRTWQICGITSFQMYLETKRIPYVWWNISLVYESLLYWTYKYDPRYIEPTDFNISPMYHKAFLEYIKDRYNITWKSIVWTDISGSVKHLHEWKFVLLSLNQNIRDMKVNQKYVDYTGRHIVVLTWYKIKDKIIESIFIHNSSWFLQNNSQENFEIPISIAKQVFARKIIILE
jgi:uncharacterized protein YvpB